MGFFLPLVLAIPIQSNWPQEIKTLFTVAAYAAAGAITAAAAGKLTGKSFWQTSLEILVLGVIGYQGVWKPSNIAPAIERRTNVTKTAAMQTGGMAGQTGTVSIPPAVEALVISGARLVDEMARKLAATNEGVVNAVNSNRQPSHEMAIDEPGALAADANGNAGPEKSAAAWVRPAAR